MSTFGTALVIDVPETVEPLQVLAPLRGDPGQFYLLPIEPGWRRIIGLIDAVDLTDAVKAALAVAGTARAALAEDSDDLGALWAVLKVEGDTVETVHRRYILNVDPADSDAIAEALEEFEQDPRELDVPGEEAAARAAEVFGVEPDSIIAAEHDWGSAYEGIGIIGGPFPWWDALDLPWPDGSVGLPLDQ